jgi:integrase
MTALRQKMIEDLRLQGLAETSEATYLWVVSAFARHFGRSPAELGPDHVREFLLDRRARGRKPSTLASYWSALRFLYVVTLGRKDFAEQVPRPRQRSQPNRVPPTLHEVRAVFEHARTPVALAFFKTCYGGGLRLNEALQLQVRDIDSVNELLHVRHGKGDRVRAVHLAPELLEALRAYWREVRPKGDWVFPACRRGCAFDRVQWEDHPVHPTTMQRHFRQAVAAAKLSRHMTLHDLRRAYATHLFEHGIELRRIQEALGHAGPGTTARYAHVSAEQIRTMPTPLSFL